MLISEVKLRSAMVRQAMNGTDLMKKAGVSSITLNRVWRGQNVHAKTVGKFASALNVEPEYLLQTDDEQQESIKAAEERDKLIVRYTRLCRQLSEIPRGESWLPEYEDLEKLLKSEIMEIRGQLGMDK